MGHDDDNGYATNDVSFDWFLRKWQKPDAVMRLHHFDDFHYFVKLIQKTDVTVELRSVGTEGSLPSIICWCFRMTRTVALMAF